MKDEERQALNFEGKYQYFRIAFSLIPDSESLSINVVHIVTREKYTQLIDNKCIAENQHFDCFKDPIVIFDYLTQNFEKVKVDHGNISFLYVWGKAIKKEKQVHIQLIKQQRDQVKIEKLTQQLHKRDAKIKEIEGMIQYSQQELQEKTAIIKELIMELQQFKKKDQQNTQIIKNLKKKVEILSSQKQESKFLKKIDQIQMQQIKWIATSFAHHPKNSHQKYFSLSQRNYNTFASLKMTQGSNYIWYNFVNGEVIYPNQKRRYTFKVNKTANQFIMIGFCTNAGLGNIANYQHPQSCYMKCLKYVYQGGVEAQFQAYLCQGQELIVEADLINGLIRYIKQNSFLTQRYVPSLMLGKAVYLSILMCDVDDEVELKVQ